MPFLVNSRHILYFFCFISTSPCKSRLPADTEKARIAPGKGITNMLALFLRMIPLNSQGVNLQIRNIQHGDFSLKILIKIYQLQRGHRIRINHRSLAQEAMVHSGDQLASQIGTDTPLCRTQNPDCGTGYTPPHARIACST